MRWRQFGFAEPGLAAIISAAVPATSGTAKLVPMVTSLMPV
jgi:hypothetical protein